MFEEYLEVYEIVNILALIVGILFGAIAQKNQFCFGGGIKDYIETKSTKRAASVVIAMISAIITTYFVTTYFEVDLTETPYLKENINYFTIILGGVLFGIGMIVSDGCSARHMVKSSQGDIYSVIALLFIAISAYATIKGILNPLVFPLIQNSFLLELSSYITNFTLNIYFVLILLTIFLLFLIKGDFKKILGLYDGILIGILVGVMWYVTGIIGAESMEKTIGLSSLSFIYSSGETLQTITDYNLIGMRNSVVLIIGIFIGAFLMSLGNKNYSKVCNKNPQPNKLQSKIVGGTLMGVGGVMAIGCTIGQGLTGLSTLALGSVVAISSILISAYFSIVILKRYNQNI